MKKEELEGIKMRLRFLDIPPISSMKAELAKQSMWRKLFDSGWYEEDLIQRAYAHLKWTEREAKETNRPHFLGNAVTFLNTLAHGFLHPFDGSKFMPKADDPQYELKVNAVKALEKSSKFFAHRVPAVVWDSYAYIATRNDPNVSRSILTEATELPHHYAVCDTMLHGVAKCYKMMFGIQSDFWQGTGCVLDHNCDCSCTLLIATFGQNSVIFDFDKKWILEATQSAFTHICAESHLILNCHLPFEYTVTKEAQYLEGIEVEEAVNS
jgi:hypothetical protein